MEQDRQPGFTGDGAVMAVDIETVPRAAALAAPYPSEERQPPANYKTDEAISKWRERDRAAWADDRVKECSLSPRTGRVVAIGLAYRDDHGEMVEVGHHAAQEADEKALLERFWKLSVQNDRLVTFNGLDFDLPFLMVRSAILGVKNPWGGTLVQRYKTQYHFDVRAVLTQWSSRGKGTLAEWLDAFGLAGKTGSGADVYPLVQQGRITEVAQYAAADAARTLLLYELVAPVFE